MSSDGYTLVEMLAALAMVGLAIGGLLEATHVIGRLEAVGGRSIEDAETTRSVQDRLARLVGGQGPFFSDDAEGFTGSSSGFRFTCKGHLCSAKLIQTRGRWRVEVASVDAPDALLDLPKAEDPRFIYSDDRASADVWPEPDLHRERLDHITLVTGADGVPLASVRLWIDEPRDCRFDAVAEGCRK